MKNNSLGYAQGGLEIFARAKVCCCFVFLFFLSR